MFINIKIIQVFLLIKENLRHIFHFFIYTVFFFVITLLGFWKILPLVYHVILAALFFLSPFYYIYLYKNKFRYIKNRNAIIWLEEKNFSKINPLTSLFDKPINQNSDGVKWKLHLKKSYNHTRKIKYFFPKININLVDPLKTRFLLVFFLVITLFWSAKNDKMFINIYSILTVKTKNAKENNIISSKIWLVPPRYTQIMQKEIYIDSENSKKEDNIKIPINSKLKVKIQSKSQKLNFVTEKNKTYFEEIEKNNFELDYKIIDNQNFIIQNDDKVIKKIYFTVIPDKYPSIDFDTEPEIAGSSIKFITNASDDYRVRKVLVSILRPTKFKHFKDKAINFDLEFETNENPKKIKNYFYLTRRIYICNHVFV